MNSKSLSSMKIIAVAVASALTTPMALAQDDMPVDVDVYGRAHVTVDQLDDGQEDGLNVSSNSSRIGFRAKAEVAPGLTGKVQLEQEVRFDDSDDGEFGFASRDSFVGLEGGFGGLRAGYFDTPLKSVGSTADMFRDQIGDIRNLTRLDDVSDADFDSRFRNGIHYYTPKIAGMRVDAHYSTNTSTSTNPPDDEATAFSVALNLLEVAPGLWAAVAYEQQEAAEDSDAIRAGASYTMGDLKLAALYQMATLKAAGADDRDIDTYGIGASYKFGDAVAKAQYYMSSDDLDDADASLAAVGVDYSLSKAFKLLFAYAMTTNDDNAGYSMSAGGHGDQVSPVAAGEDPSGFSAGVRYDF